MAVELVLQRRRDEQLAAFVRASFRTITLGTLGTQSAQRISMAVVVANLFLGARGVIAGSLTVGELVGCNMLAAQVAQPVLRPAQLRQDFQQVPLAIAPGQVVGIAGRSGWGKSTLAELI